MDENSRTASRAGYWFALAALVAAAGYSIAQVLQVVGVLPRPFDEILIFGFSLCLSLPCLLALLALHYVAPAGRRFWSHAAVLLAAMYAAYVNLNYVVQLATVLPAKLGGAATVPVIDQTAHSLFWDADGLGYLCLGLATLLAAPVFSGRPRQRWLRGFFIANGLMVPVLAVVYFSPVFSIPLLLCAAPWIVTTCGSLWLLMRFFRQQARETALG